MHCAVVVLVVLHELTASFLVVCSASLVTDGVKVGMFNLWGGMVCVCMCAHIRVCSGVVAATTHPDTVPPGLVCVCGPS